MCFSSDIPKADFESLQLLLRKLPGRAAVILRAAALRFACLLRFPGKFGTEFFKFSMEIICLAVFQKALIACLRAEHFAGVLDRAEILLGTRRDFLRVAQQPDRV